MPKRAVVFVTIALFSFALTPHLAKAITVPIEETPTAPAGGILQTAVGDFVSGAEAVMA
jgi:hypothetical protein